MSIILPNLNHSFVPVPVPVPDSGFRFRIPDFRVFHTPGVGAQKCFISFVSRLSFNEI